MVEIKNYSVVFNEDEFNHGWVWTMFEDLMATSLISFY
jgi:hypothetical protein